VASPTPEPAGLSSAANSHAAWDGQQAFLQILWRSGFRTVVNFELRDERFVSVAPGGGRTSCKPGRKTFRGRHPEAVRAAVFRLSRSSPDRAPADQNTALRPLGQCPARGVFRSRSPFASHGVGLCATVRQVRVPRGRGVPAVQLPRQWPDHAPRGWWRGTKALSWHPGRQRPYLVTLHPASGMDNRSSASPEENRMKEGFAVTVAVCRGTSPGASRCSRRKAEKASAADHPSTNSSSAETTRVWRGEGAVVRRRRPADSPQPQGVRIYRGQQTWSIRRVRMDRATTSTRQAGPPAARLAPTPRRPRRPRPQHAESHLPREPSFPPGKLRQAGVAWSSRRTVVSSHPTTTTEDATTGRVPRARFRAAGSCRPEDRHNHRPSAKATCGSGSNHEHAARALDTLKIPYRATLGDLLARAAQERAPRPTRALQSRRTNSDLISRGRSSASKTTPSRDPFHSQGRYQAGIQAAWSSSPQGGLQ